VAPDDLGFSLASVAAGLPRTTEALKALIVQHGGEAPPLERGEGAIDSVAGVAPCALDEERLAVRGGKLWRPSPAPAFEERLQAGATALASGLYPEARSAFATASRLQPDTAEARLRVADSYAAEGRWTEAARAYQRVVDAFPWSAQARAGHARCLRQLGQVSESVRALARALALHPASAPLRAALEQDRAAEVVPPVPPPAFRRQDERGVRWVIPARAGGPAAVVEAAAYARCKEAFRTSEPLRQAAAGLAGPRWRWSVAEETACTVLWLSAYLEQREQGRAADPELDALGAIVRNGQGDQRSLFDVGAAAHPEATAFLDDAGRERLFEFVLTRRAGRRAGEGWLLP
jgi:tetratricopeptide (TPR) repeat protein